MRFDLIDPMLAKMGEEELLDNPHNINEMKLNGIRCLVYVDSGVILSTRGVIGEKLTERFPEVVSHLEKAVPNGTILDGELLIIKDGKHDRNAIVGRANRIHDIDKAAKENPAIFSSFDVLFSNYETRMDNTCEERRVLLEDIVHVSEGLRLCHSQVGGGRDLFNLMRLCGFEGIVVKDPSGKYQPGKRSGLWRKVKVGVTEEFYAVALTRGKGRYAEYFGAVVLVDKDMNYVAKCGIGFTNEKLDAWTKWSLGVGEEESLLDYHGIPKGVSKSIMRWIPPTKVAVKYAERTPDGSLDHPRLKI